MTDEWIVAAGIEQHQVDLGSRFLHLIEHAGKADPLHEHIALVRRVGVDGHDIIQAVRFDAVAGEIEQRHVRADQFLAESLQRMVEARLVEIDLRAAADHEEAERAQRIRYQSGVGR